MKKMVTWVFGDVFPCYSCSAEHKQAAICQTCGATGFEEFLIYCSECRISAEHLYCERKIPENWKCELCKARDPKTLSPCQLGFYRYRNRKNVKRRVKKTNCVLEKVLLQKSRIDNIGRAAVKKIDRSYGTSERTHHLSIVDTPKNDVSEPTHYFGVVDTSKIGNPVKFLDVSNIEGFSAKIEKDKNFKQPRRLVLAEEDEIDKDVSGPIGNSGFDKLVSQTGKALSTQDTSIITQDTSINVAYVPAMPMIDHIWRGCFEISNVVYGPLSAHPSNAACKKVWDSAKMLPQLLHAEKLSRLDVWPKCFEVSPPNELNIGLYFFPHYERAESMHDQFLYDLINKDIALKVTLDTAELIIFTSIILPEGFRRFQGKLYLWGVFRGRKAPVQFQGCAEEEQKEPSSPNVQNSEDGTLAHYLGKLKKLVPLPRMLDRCLSKLGQLDENKHHEEKHLLPQKEEIEEVESIAITTRSTSGNGVFLDLEIGRSGSNQAWHLDRGSEIPLINTSDQLLVLFLTYLILFSIACCLCFVCK